MEVRSHPDGSSEQGYELGIVLPPDESVQSLQGSGYRATPRRAEKRRRYAAKVMAAMFAARLQ